MRTRLPAGTLVLFLLWLAVMGAVAVLMLDHEPPGNGAAAPAPVNGVPLQPFDLVDHQGRAFSLGELRGHWTFVLFGHTRCRQGCPSALTELAYMVRDLQADSGRGTGVQVVFATVDPVHDTPDVLAKYLSFFPRGFIGVTGKPEKVRAFAAQFGIRPGRAQTDGSVRSEVGDPEIIFLVDAESTVAASFYPPHDRARLTAMYTELRASVAEHRNRP